MLSRLKTFYREIKLLDETIAKNWENLPNELKTQWKVLRLKYKAYFD